MRIFVAGATGAMGVPLVKRLVALGQQVTGLTRSESKRALLEGLGATAVVADVFERERLGAVLREARPEVVVHLLTALPKRWMPLVGDGSGVWSWLHLEDAAEATVAAIEKGSSGEVYNIVDDEPVTWRDYLTCFARVLGAPSPRRAPLWLVRLASAYAAISLTSRIPISNAKARRELGWKPAYPTYREGLATLVPQGAGDSARVSSGSPG